MSTGSVSVPCCTNLRAQYRKASSASGAQSQPRARIEEDRKRASRLDAGPVRRLRGHPA